MLLKKYMKNTFNYLLNIFVFRLIFIDVTGGKAPQTAIQKLANKARQFNKCVRKAEGHLKRLGDENDRER